MQPFNMEKETKYTLKLHLHPMFAQIFSEKPCMNNNQKRNRSMPASYLSFTQSL